SPSPDDAPSTSAVRPFSPRSTPRAWYALPLGRQHADDLAHRVARGLEGRLLVVREVELDDLFDPARAELAGDAHVEAVDPVLALEIGGAGQDAPLVEHDRVDHLRGGRARRVPGGGAHEVHELAAALRRALDHRPDRIVAGELAQRDA